MIVASTHVQLLPLFLPVTSDVVAEIQKRPYALYTVVNVRKLIAVLLYFSQPRMYRYRYHAMTKDVL